MLTSVMNGQTATVRGKVIHGPHDRLLDMTNCKSVVLVYAGDTSGKVVGDGWFWSSGAHLRISHGNRVSI
jgi:hypothetical protein